MAGGNEIDGQPTVTLDAAGQPLGAWPVKNPAEANAWTFINVAGPDGKLQRAIMALTTDPNNALAMCETPVAPIVTILTHPINPLDELSHDQTILIP